MSGRLFFALRESWAVNCRNQALALKTPSGRINEWNRDFATVRLVAALPSPAMASTGATAISFPRHPSSTPRKPSIQQGWVSC